MNPLQSKKMHLPLDCNDLEWSDNFTVPSGNYDFLPAPKKSLAETLGELVAAVRGHNRPANALATALSR